MNKKGNFSLTKNTSSINELFDESNDILTLSINNIKPNPYQPRTIFNEESLEELSQSIKKHGLIQPILVKKDENNEYILVAGERRLKACQRINLTEIKAIITKGNPIEISLIENLQRENLKPIEEAEALQKMINKYSYTQEKLAIAIGKKKSTVSEILSINKIPNEIKEKVRHAELSKRNLIEIAKLKSTNQMKEIIDKIQNQELPLKNIRNVIRKNNKNSNLNVNLKKIITFSKFIETILNIDENEIINELVKLKINLENIINKQKKN